MVLTLFQLDRDNFLSPHTMADFFYETLQKRTVSIANFLPQNLNNSKWL